MKTPGLAMMPNRKIKVNKLCMVPECSNTTLTTPDKLFKSVPRKEELKKRWFEAVRSNTKWNIRTTRYCCEDHFDLPGDLANSGPILGKHQNMCLKMKPGVVPHRFDCCKTKTTTIDSEQKALLINQDKIHQPLNSNTLYIVEEGKTGAVENMESDFIPTNSNENSSELGIQITEVHSVTQELENFINFEVDTNEVVEELDLTSDDFWQESDGDLTKKIGDCSEEIPIEDNGPGKHIANEAVDEETTRSPDSDDDPFEEDMTIANANSEETEAIEIPSSDDETINNRHSPISNDVHFTVLNSEEPPHQEIMNDNDSQENTGTNFECSNNKESLCDDENTNDANSKVCSDKDDNAGIHFLFLNDKGTLHCENTSDRQFEDGGTNFKFVDDKELDDCLIVDLSNDAEEITQETADVYKSKTKIRTATEDSDCIVISEGENSSDMENMAGMDDITFETPLFHMPKSGGKDKNSANDSVDEEITEKYILENFEIIDDEDDSVGNVPERLKDAKKIIIQRTNSLYPCPSNCTFLATDRESIIEHLISHEKKRKLQETKAYRCPLCPYKSIDKDDFIHHIVHHKEPYFACNYCNYVGPKLSCLKVHMYENHGATLSCDNCHFKVNELGKYFAHQLKCVLGHTKKSRPRQKSESKDELRCHFDPCPFTANDREALKTHEWIQHQLSSNNIKRFKCYIDYCNVDTLRHDVFEAHIDAHPGFQLQCKQCPYRTLDWDNFKDHVINHVRSSDQ